METTKGVGRTIGVLLLVQLTAGLLMNFVLLGPVFGAPGFWVNAAAHSSLIGLAAVFSQLTAVAMPLFGHDVVFLMLAPLGVCQLVLALWLIAKGWRVHINPRHKRSDA